MTRHRAEPSLQGFGVSRRFSSASQSIVALDDVDLSVAPGELVVVQGPSGCGKSTLLSIFGLLDRPSSGEVVMLGRETSALTNDERARLRRSYVAYLFQDAGLIDRMSVRDNVGLPLLYGGLSARERTPRIAAALKAVGMADRSASQVDELSGGQRQRIGVARALVGRPKVLICDEPTASLDKANSIAIAELLVSEARRGMAILCSTHDPTVMERASRVVNMAHGRLGEAVAHAPALIET